jgi:ATP-dependent Lon protease
LRAIQLSQRDVLDKMMAARAKLTTAEWKDFLLRSIGLEPAQLTERNKDAMLLRMVPFVERNYNMVEIGPRGTGKSHLFQQVSPYAHLVSGGKATVARMFVNNANGQRGLVCQYDVVCFDEVSGISFDQKDGVNIMKGYMESGEFSRGKESIRADGSIVMVGNFDVDIEHQQRIGHLFSAAAARDARRHRVHGSHPLLPAGLGCAQAQAGNLHRSLRTGQRLPLRMLHTVAQPKPPGGLQNRVFFGGALSGRDINGVNKTISGLLKLISPAQDAAVSDEDLEWAVRWRWKCAARQGTAEAHRRRRVPQHAFQLHAGRRRRREIRLDA